MSPMQTQSSVLIILLPVGIFSFLPPLPHWSTIQWGEVNASSEHVQSNPDGMIPTAGLNHLHSCGFLKSTLPGWVIHPQISHDGTMLLFESDKAGNQDVFVTKLDWIKPMHVTFGTAKDANPSWSPMLKVCISTRPGWGTGVSSKKI